MLLDKTRFALKIFGRNFSDRNFSARLLWRHVLLQKIIGVNRHVPWPVHWTTQVKGLANITKGSRMPGLSMGCYLDGRNGIVIGKNTWIGPGVKIISMNHENTNFNHYVKAPPIEIGRDCWLGSNVVILPSVKLGDHTIVAAGAVVSHSFPHNDQLIGGVPAKVIKKLPPYIDQFENGD